VREIPEDQIDDIVNSFPSGESRLWCAVVVRAVNFRRWDFFLDPDSLFPLAAGACGLDVQGVRERMIRKRGKLRQCGSADRVIP